MEQYEKSGPKQERPAVNNTAQDIVQLEQLIKDQGEQIATVGHTGGIQQNGLYFEIRQRGKAISPLAWLS